MKRETSRFATASLLALAMAAGAASARAQTVSPAQPTIVLPSLPDAPVVLGKPGAPVPTMGGADAKTPPTALAPAPSAPARATQLNGGSAAIEKTSGPAGTPAVAGKDPAPGAVAKTPTVAAPAVADKASAAPATAKASEGSEPAAAAPPEPPLEVALDAFVKGGAQKGRAAVALRKEREEIASFYASRQYAPLWLARQDWTPGARATLVRLKAAADEGLDPARLHIPTLGSGNEASQFATELALTQSVIAYGEEASGGRVNPHMISALIAEPPSRLDPAEILQRIAAAADPSAALEDFNPPQAGYRALRAKLAELRAAQSAAAAARIPRGPTLHVGMSDPRVPIIRARFGLEAPDEPSDIYDESIAAAVAGFQRSVGLVASGRLTPRTVALLSGRNADALESDLIVNMEFWRWQPRDMGTNRIEINIPDYSLALYHGDDVIHTARVIVGKPTTQTPVFSNEVRFIVINPSWYVPQSIIKKEMLPKLAADPDYLQRQGYVVTRKGSQIEVRQPPGPRNALGQIKFLFPNDYAVYLHDTPDRDFFRDSKRAFSHGCVRMQDPFALAELIFGRERGWSEERLKSMVGGDQHTLRLAQPLPIHLEYFTAAVDADGRVQSFSDIYGYAQKTKAALGLRA